MATFRRVFFSFHFQRDSWRAAQVRNSNVVRRNYAESNRYIDAVAWEKVKRSGDVAIKRWIGGQMHGTSVTVVLIGAETSTRYWVRYEIEQSTLRNNGLLGVYIHNIRDQSKNIDLKEDKPLGYRYDYPVYDWEIDYGYANLGKWIEDAALAAGR